MRSSSHWELLRSALIGNEWSLLLSLQMIQEKTIELHCFKGLAGHEAIALPQRLADMKALVTQQEEREQKLQGMYGEVIALTLQLPS